jgi:guanylate kinase
MSAKIITQRKKNERIVSKTINEFRSEEKSGKMKSKSNPFNLHLAEPLLIVISGPSGVGKDTVIRQMKSRDLPFHFVVTATTRPKRPGEVHGKDYFFVTSDEFAEMIENDELLEYAFVYNDHKGIPKEQVRQALASGKDVIMRIDVQGADTIREIIPDALLIFLTTRDEEELVNRLKARKTETPGGLKLRIATARQELKRLDLFDYVVINRENQLDDTVDTIMAIIKAEHHKVHYRKVRL